MSNPESGPKNEPLPELDFDLLNKNADTTGNTEKIDDLLPKENPSSTMDVPVIRQQTPFPEGRSKEPRSDWDTHNILTDQAKK